MLSESTIMTIGMIIIVYGLIMIGNFLIYPIIKSKLLYRKNKDKAEELINKLFNDKNLSLEDRENELIKSGLPSLVLEIAIKKWQSMERKNGKEITKIYGKEIKERSRRGSGDGGRDRRTTKRRRRERYF